MSRQLSFTKNENLVLPHFRFNISRAESTEDVKKFFVYAVQELFDGIFNKDLSMEYEDIELSIDKKPSYSLSQKIVSQTMFKEVWEESDLSRVISRLADTAEHRYKHLKKSPEKTDQKIRM